MFKFISKIDEKTFQIYQDNIYNFLVSDNSKEFQSKHISEMVFEKIINTYKSKK